MLLVDVVPDQDSISVDRSARAINTPKSISTSECEPV